MENNQKGLTNTLILLVVLVIIVLGLFFLIKKNRMDGLDTQPMYKEPSETFESMKEDESTPEEIDNKSVEELDQIFVDIESSTPNEDFSDISF